MCVFVIGKMFRRHATLLLAAFMTMIPDLMMGMMKMRGEGMNAGFLPGVVWVVLILALIPGVQAVLEQFFPATEYWYSALIVAVLGRLRRRSRCGRSSRG